MDWELAWTIILPWLLDLLRTNNQVNPCYNKSSKNLESKDLENLNKLTWILNSNHNQGSIIIEIKQINVVRLFNPANSSIVTFWPRKGAKHRKYIQDTNLQKMKQKKTFILTTSHLWYIIENDLPEKCKYCRCTSLRGRFWWTCSSTKVVNWRWRANSASKKGKSHQTRIIRWIDMSRWECYSSCCWTHFRRVIFFEDALLTDKDTKELLA